MIVSVVLARIAFHDFACTGCIAPVPFHASPSLKITHNCLRLLQHNQRQQGSVPFTIMTRWIKEGRACGLADWNAGEHLGVKLLFMKNGSASRRKARDKAL